MSSGVMPEQEILNSMTDNLLYCFSFLTFPIPRKFETGIKSSLNPGDFLDISIVFFSIV